MMEQSPPPGNGGVGSTFDAPKAVPTSIAAGIAATAPGAKPGAAPAAAIPNTLTRLLEEDCSPFFGTAAATGDSLTGFSTRANPLQSLLICSNCRLEKGK